MIATYEAGDVFLSMLEFFFLIVFFWLLITVFSDLFRDHSLSGWAKAAWIVFVVVIPFIGILIYMIARGSGMQERAIKEQEQVKAQFDDYVKETASAASPAEELTKLARLHDTGKLSDTEYASLKAKVLAT